MGCFRQDPEKHLTRILENIIVDLYEDVKLEKITGPRKKNGAKKKPAAKEKEAIEKA